GGFLNYRLFPRPNRASHADFNVVTHNVPFVYHRSNCVAHGCRDKLHLPQYINDMFKGKCDLPLQVKSQ
ncbi:hypothetical protein, partial [Haemophilus influenzae]|uniref:hypothetical protein n=1 Tax=Haemophilus influenzae TaxID=727 RepID=UPI001C99CB27